MSLTRAAFMIALHETLGRLPTPEEKHAFLKAMARECGGERIYIAHRVLTAAEIEPEILRLHADGWSVRRIAGATGWGKSYVAQVVAVHKLALLVDTEAA